MEEEIEIKQVIVRKILFGHLANLVNYPILQINAKVIEENQVFTQYAPI